jgi:DNA repair exonuclease SbcCD nuclease subunit
MRIVHLADTHLGYRHLTRTDEAGRNVREEDIYQVFGEAIERIIELKPDVVIHAGDLFDSYHPTSRALGAALDAVRRLKRARIPLVVIAGNHSTPRYAHVGHVFEVLDRFGGVHAVWREPETIEFGDLAVHAIPHHPDAQLLEQSIRAAEPREGVANVLVLHAGLDGLARVGTGEAGSVSISGGSLEAAAGFDYIALGHLHAREGVRVNACYAGSLERLSFADQEARKGFVEADLSLAVSDSGRVRFHDTTPRPMATVGPIDGSLDGDLTERIIDAAARIELEGAIVRCVLIGVDQDRFRALDLPRLRNHFARCLHFELQPEFARATPGIGAPQDLRAFLAARGKRQGLQLEELLDRTQRLLVEVDATTEP